MSRRCSTALWMSSSTGSRGESLPPPPSRAPATVAPRQASGTSRRTSNVVNHGGRCLAGRHDEGFEVEATDETLMRPAEIVGLDVALIPGEPEGRIRNLDHEEIEVGVRRQAFDLDGHDLQWADRVDTDESGGVGEADGHMDAFRQHQYE